ncbi:hypothetical protein [Bradyrhizobium zhanjiangense]|uniref:hypothetical protein n=1 Tax=Bradyrhizobium zhanjiangense TaxID=1325107 RepID=UPI0010087A6B|nr:hypothetical protein [Bradyrhizobium zhanjiangense]
MNASDLPEQSIQIGEFQHVSERIERGELVLNAIGAVLEGSRRPSPNWDSVGHEQLRSIKRPKTRASCEVRDDFSTLYRAHGAMKG